MPEKASGVGSWRGPNGLVGQGTDDESRANHPFPPPGREAACREQGQALDLRMQPGYDHSDHFIATFIGEHLAHHTEALTQRP